MDTEPKFVRWLDLPEAEPVKFGDLPGLIASALHSDGFAQAAAEINLESELRGLVDSGALVVRDSLTLGRHPFPMGDALRRGVLLPYEDLRPLLESRGIGLRLTPYGTGPDLWTVENAAAAIAAQEGWHQGARDTLRQQMMQAAQNGQLTVRHPQTKLAYRPAAVHRYYELVTPADVNAWLRLDPASSLRWSVAESLVPAVTAAADTTAPPVVPVPTAAESATQTHKLKRRGDALAAVLTLAEKQALDAKSWQSVWASLVLLAQSANRPAPLLGYTEGEGVKYQTDKADRPDGWLTRDAYRARFNRQP